MIFNILRNKSLTIVTGCSQCCVFCFCNLKKYDWKNGFGAGKCTAPYAFYDFLIYTRITGIPIFPFPQKHYLKNHFLINNTLLITRRRQHWPPQFFLVNSWHIWLDEPHGIFLACAQKTCRLTLGRLCGPSYMSAVKHDFHYMLFSTVKGLALL